MAAAPWLGSQVPWCRHLGGGMRGPQCVRAAMLSLWGHLRHLPVPPWGFPRTLGATSVRCHVIILFGTRPGPWGSPLPARGRVTELLASRLASKVSARLSAPEIGQAESWGARGWGARPSPLQPRGPRQGTQLLRGLSLCPRHFGCIFYIKRNVGERRERVSCPGPRLWCLG